MKKILLACGFAGVLLMCMAVSPVATQRRIEHGSGCLTSSVVEEVLTAAAPAFDVEYQTLNAAWQCHCDLVEITHTEAGEFEVAYDGGVFVVMIDDLT